MGLADILVYTQAFSLMNIIFQFATPAALFLATIKTHNNADGYFLFAIYILQDVLISSLNKFVSFSQIVKKMKQLSLQFKS